MAHITKCVGLALLATCALFALAASPAGAATLQAESYPATLVGEQGTEEQHVFTFEGSNSLSCEEANFTGELTEASTSFTVSPEYSGCTAFGFSATVDMNGCDYVYTIGEPIEEGYEGSMDIVCPEGESIEIAAGTCGVEIESQEAIFPIIIIIVIPAGDAAAFLAGAAIGAAIGYWLKEDGFLCPANGTGKKTGKFDGGTDVHGYTESEEEQDLSIE